MTKTIPQEQVIQRFRTIHGDKYDYSEVQYEKMLIKVCIICPLHGRFLMRPNDHIWNHGCPTCGSIQGNKTKIKNEKASVDEHGKTKFEKRYEKIHETRRRNQNYKSAAIKRIHTMKSNGSYETWRRNWYNKMVEIGKFSDPSDYDFVTYERFKRRVYRETRKTLKRWGYLINFDSTLFTTDRLVVDHKYSVNQGFLNKVSVYTLSHIRNLTVMDHSSNSRKGSTCSISLEQLLEDINNFDQTCIDG